MLVKNLWVLKELCITDSLQFFSFPPLFEEKVKIGELIGQNSNVPLSSTMFFLICATFRKKIIYITFDLFFRERVVFILFHDVLSKKTWSPNSSQKAALFTSSSIEEENIERRAGLYTYCDH